MTKNRFTIICEFKGGTYISQVFATDEINAVRRWAEEIAAEKPIKGSSVRIARNVLSHIETYGLTPLDGLHGIWCFFTSLGDNYILGNIVLSA